jgi:hypothetical protein
LDPGLQDIDDLEKQILQDVDFNGRLTTPHVFLRAHFRSVAQQSDAESIGRLEKVLMFFRDCGLPFGDRNKFGAEAITVTCLFLRSKLLALPYV